MDKELDVGTINLAVVASDAALELEQYMQGKETDLTNVKALVQWLSDSCKLAPYHRNISAILYMLTVLGLMPEKFTFKDLLRGTSKLVKGLKQIVSGECDVRVDISKYRDLCLSLAKFALAHREGSRQWLTQESKQHCAL